MLSSNYIYNTPSEETKTMASLDSDPSVYSCESYTGPQEFRQSMKLDDLDVLKLIGAGGSGKVYLVKHKITGGLYALKVIPKVRRSHCLPQETQRILDEQVIQAAISKTTGTFLLPLVASWNDECNFYIMTEYIRGGDLAFEVLRCKCFDASRTRFYAAELVLALENLHKLNIVHRDVKPGNIFLDAAGHIILADYGFSKKFETGSGGFAADVGSVNFQVEPGCNEGAFLIPQTIVSAAKTNEVVGTPYAMSPEQHYGCEYSYDADIWGLGITIYRMLTGRIPFARDAKNINEMAHGIAFEPIVFFDDENIDPITDDFIHGLLAKNAQDRLTIPQIKAHEYFKDIDWFEVAAKSYPVPWTPHVSPTPKFPKDKSALMAGAAYLPSEDPHPEFNFVAGHINFTTPATPDEKPFPAEKKSTTFLGNIFGRLFTGPGKPLPATEEPGSMVSKAANCESGPPTIAAKRKAALKPLVLPKIAARRSLELQTRRQSSSIGGLISTTVGPYSPLSPGPSSTAGSSPRDSLFAISRATSPTTVSSLSPACTSGFSSPVDFETDGSSKDYSGSPPPVPGPTLVESPNRGLGVSTLASTLMPRGAIPKNTRQKPSLSVRQLKHIADGCKTLAPLPSTIPGPSTASRSALEPMADGVGVLQTDYTKEKRVNRVLGSVKAWVGSRWPKKASSALA